MSRRPRSRGWLKWLPVLCRSLEDPNPGIHCLCWMSVMEYIKPRRQTTAETDRTSKIKKIEFVSYNWIILYFPFFPANFLPVTLCDFEFNFFFILSSFTSENWYFNLKFCWLGSWKWLLVSFECFNCFKSWHSRSQIGVN